MTTSARPDDRGCVVECTWTFTRDGRSARGTVRVEAPVPVDEGEAACAVAIEARGVWEQRARLSGADPLHALLLATRFLGLRLRDFLAKGGRVTYDDDTDVPIEVYFPKTQAS